MKTRKKPYTTHELFHEIDSILKEKGLLPSFLDYGIASGKKIRKYGHVYGILSSKPVSGEVREFTWICIWKASLTATAKTALVF